MPKIADTYAKVKLTGYTRGIRGHRGPQGPQGEQGIQGPQGYRGPKGLIGEVGLSPAFSIGTVEIDDTATITTTGTDESPILNMTIPKGEKGDTGESPIVTLTKEDKTSTMEVELEGETNTYEFVDGEHQYEAGDGITIENNVVTNTTHAEIYDEGTAEKTIPNEINDALGGVIETEEIKGNTTQDGTPTPTAPVPINVVSGRQDIVVAQENALDIQRIVKGRLDNGNIGYESNVTNLDLGEESFSFTTNANYRGVTTDFIHLRTSTFIYFGYESVTTNIGATVSYYDENMKFISQSGGYGMTNAVRYGNSVANAKYIRIYFALNTAGSVTITKPQIRFSNENSIPTYEAYKGNTYEINLGKNLLPYPYVDSSKTLYGITYTVNQDGSITCNGTATNNSTFTLVIASIPLAKPERLGGRDTLPKPDSAVDNAVMS